MKKLLLFLLGLLISGNVYASSITMPYCNTQTGGYIFASQWNANCSAVQTFLNNQNIDGTTNIAIGGVQTANIANLAVTDAKIFGITTASKVNGSALTGLANIPAGGGVVPPANLGTGTPTAYTVLLGNGTWGAANAYVKVSETESSGTNGGSASTGSWVTRVLNTTDTDTQSISTLGSNQVTLPSGTYIVHISCPFFATKATQTRLYDVTHTTSLLIGTSEYGGSANATSFRSRIDGLITLSASSALAVQYQVSFSTGTSDLGTADSFGTEVYSVAEFTKIS